MIKFIQDKNGGIGDNATVFLCLLTLQKSVSELKL